MGALDRVFRSRRPSQERPVEAIIAGLWSRGEQGGFMDPRDIDRYMSMRGPELFNSAAPLLLGESQNLGGGLVRVYTSAGAYSAVATPVGSVTPGRRYVVEGVVTQIAAAASGVLVESRENPLISALGSFRFVVTAVTNYIAIKRNNAALTDFTLSGVTVREWLGETSCTMWQDASGTLPVVSAGQPIGLWLDKRKGLIRGPELITNGDFSAGAASWGVSNNDATHTATFASGALQFKVDSLTPALTVSQPAVMVPGRWYEVTVVVSAWASGTIKTDAFAQASAMLASGTGVFTARLLAVSSFFSFTRGTPTVDLTVDSISVRELPGNHAYMATTTGRATLSARYNLLTKSQDFSDAAVWVTQSSGTGSAPVRTKDFAAAPDGSMTATRLQLALNGGTAVSDRSGVAQTVSSTTTGAGYGCAIWLKAASAGSVGRIVLLRHMAGTTYLPCVLTAEWKAFGRVEAAGTTYGVVTLELRGSSGGASDAVDVLAWGADIRLSNDGIGMPPYQRVTSATDYDTAGFPWYVLPDGVDDMFETAAVDMSGAAAITFGTAVRRARDTGLGCIVEATTNYSTSNGTFILLAPGVSDTPSVAWNAKGTTLAGGMSISTAAAPVSSVIVATANIETAERTLSVNDTSLTNSASIGTGTLGIHKLYFFQRGSGGMAFSGRIYGWIWVARALSKAEINAIRRYYRTTARIY